MIGVRGIPLRKRDWIQIYVALGLAVLLDQATKGWAADRIKLSSLGPFQIASVRNHGFVLGSFSDLPDGVVAVSLASLVATLLFCSALVQFLIPGRAKGLRVGLNLVVAGILGNFIDQIRAGYVIDFIRIRLPSGTTPVFNFADVIQIVGYGLMAYWLFQNRHTIFRKSEQRSRFWIDRKFQMRYCAAFVLAGTTISFSLMLFGGIFWWTSLTSISEIHRVTALHHLIAYVAVCSAMTLSFVAMLMVFGLILSNRTAGPVVAFERFLIERRKGSKAKFRVRDSDDLKSLERIVNDLLD